MVSSASGAIFYEGPSRLDGAPIVGIVTFKTENEKTGNLAQTWIMRADADPLTAIYNGLDKSMCGQCPLTGSVEIDQNGQSVNRKRGCYVKVHQAPLSVFRGYQRGIYPRINSLVSAFNKGFRYGSYGDPTAIPRKNWEYVESAVSPDESRPGYTHQWRQKRFQGWSKRLMASTHSLEENLLAHEQGWRTFRTINAVSELAPNEIICPASAEGKFRATCETCGACNGRRGMADLRRNVAIVVHGRAGVLRAAREVVSGKVSARTPLTVLKN